MYPWHAKWEWMNWNSRYQKTRSRRRKSFRIRLIFLNRNATWKVVGLGLLGFPTIQALDLAYQKRIANEWFSLTESWLPKSKKTIFSSHAWYQRATRTVNLESHRTFTSRTKPNPVGSWNRAADRLTHEIAQRPWLAKLPNRSGYSGEIVNKHNCVFFQYQANNSRIILH